MMLDWLAERHADSPLSDGARAIENALAGAFAQGSVRRASSAAAAGRATSPALSWRDCEMSETRRHGRRRLLGAVPVEGWRDAGAPLGAIANRHIEHAQALAQR